MEQCSFPFNPKQQQRRKSGYFVPRSTLPPGIVQMHNRKAWAIAPSTRPARTDACRLNNSSRFFPNHHHASCISTNTCIYRLRKLIELATTSERATRCSHSQKPGSGLDGIHTDPRGLLLYGVCMSHCMHTRRRCTEFVLSLYQ
jgi:hypothetical protein